ncbi:MAG: S-methyl-5-thioribose-1-phosphate isomerase [Planctomycetota bacterium]
MKKKIPTIAWRDGAVRAIDQTRLPNELRVVTLRTAGAMWSAIRRLTIRGAPAIGIAGAFGVVLGVRRSRAKTWPAFRRALLRVARRLATARPTAVNLFWALDRMMACAEAHRAESLPNIRRALLREAQAILAEDCRACRRIGRNGAPLIRRGAAVLTHCNAGALATAEHGTALAVLFAAEEAGKAIRVYADETRPLLQGARLTTWELMRAGIPVTLICDNMAAQLMQAGKVDLVITGADRVASNGDAANKIGTYGLAVLAKAHKIPFYIAAPESTFDLSLPNGQAIPIEERAPEEVTAPFGRRIAPRGVTAYNPAFDVTPARLITAIITEHGIIRKPSKAKIFKQLKKNRG